MADGNSYILPSSDSQNEDSVDEVIDTAQLLKTAQSISLTTNLWSSHSKHGYLGLTAIWINQDFEIIDVLLEIIYFPAPLIADAIAKAIKNIIQK
ncbi:zinc finger BED domain-containing protein 1-like [Rhizophagus clarus]|uniref:Zinc finger BED domain-containing protein 1-like n=1 Tax=Rhizophagus clarus TaxID=94130 RepID=A0A8H3LJI9_9GLOM|nr:zinc finger BED domain-containing protein 1-like [Rhizophagus clarus]